MRFSNRDEISLQGVQIESWGMKKRARVTSSSNDIPQERVQKEKDEVHDKHDRKGENGVVMAERITEQLFVIILNLHSGHHGPDWIAKCRIRRKYDSGDLQPNRSVRRRSLVRPWQAIRNASRGQ
jgi:hypothetical protein